MSRPKEYLIALASWERLWDAVGRPGPGTGPGPLQEAEGHSRALWEGLTAGEQGVVKGSLEKDPRGRYSSCWSQVTSHK